MIHSIDPQAGASGLVPHANRMTLRGTVGDARFPPLCPNCGGPAAGTISYAKVFWREDVDGVPSQYIVTRATVPFCGPCIARHRAQEVKPPWIETLKSSFASMHVVGAVFPALAALFLARIALGDLVHTQFKRAVVEAGLCALAALIAWGQGWAVWRERARFRVLPQTEVTRAFDFSDDTAPAFEARRFACTIRNGPFASAFRRLNLDHEYLPQSARAVAERRRGNAFLWIFAAVVALLLLRSCVEGLFQ